MMLSYNGDEHLWHGGGHSLISFGLSFGSKFSSCEVEVVVLLLSSSADEICGVSFEILGWFSHEKRILILEIS